jgi:hypothetical protein
LLLLATVEKIADSSKVSLNRWVFLMDSRAGGDMAPTIVNSTVARTREYLTGAEVEALMAAARKSSR